MKFRLQCLLLVSLLLISCGEKKSYETASADEESAPSAPVVAQNAPVSEGDSRKISEKKNDSSAMKDKEEERLQPISKPKTVLSGERMLEYEVSLQYKSKKFLQSRKRLLEIADSSAIIISNHSSNTGKQPYLNVKLLVKSANLYETLLKIDEIGFLKSENIRTIDHTENNVANRIKLEREQIRLKRRQDAQSKNSKDWKDRENLLSASEDSQDIAKLEKWRIRDKVTWARVKVYLYGPDRAEEVEVPKYKDAFVGMVNLFLNLLYGLVYLFPVIAVVAAGVYWYRKRKNRTS
ncbi:MAG: DUF4349 domain-containing protein [Spirochaetota bacterium]